MRLAALYCPCALGLPPGRRAAGRSAVVERRAPPRGSWCGLGVSRGGIPPPARGAGARGSLPCGRAAAGVCRARRLCAGSGTVLLAFCVVTWRRFCGNVEWGQFCRDLGAFFQEVCGVFTMENWQLCVVMSELILEVRSFCVESWCFRNQLWKRDESWCGHFRMIWELFCVLVLWDLWETVWSLGKHMGILCCARETAGLKSLSVGGV